MKYPKKISLQTAVVLERDCVGFAVLCPNFLWVGIKHESGLLDWVQYERLSRYLLKAGNTPFIKQPKTALGFPS